jgi:hypothetical protein
MKRIALLFIVAVLGCSACSSLKNSQSPEPVTVDVLKELNVGNFTIQEYISGIEGGKNTLEFLLNIDSKQTGLMPDSIRYSGYNCKLYSKNTTTHLYKATSVKKGNSLLTKELKRLFVTFKDSDLVYEQVSVKANILDPIHMP